MTTQAECVATALAAISRARHDRDMFYAGSGGDPTAVALRARSGRPERTAAVYQAMRLRAEVKEAAAAA